MYARQIYKQQQANIGYTASTERRYFSGVQDSKGQKGELFGLDNLLTFHGDQMVLRDIVHKTNVAEARQGLVVMDVDMDDIINDEDNPLTVDDDNGDGAMSQLAALITQGEKSSKTSKSKARKLDPIAAILSAGGGVEYTHENSEVVGSSKIEAELSRRAEEAGNDTTYGEKKLFEESQSQRTLDRHNDNNEELEGTVNYHFHPPEDVMTRQFCSMASTFGFDNATDFAFIVEGWTRKERTNALERFYRTRQKRLLMLDDESCSHAEGEARGRQTIYETSMSTLDDEETQDEDVEPSGLPPSVEFASAPSASLASTKLVVKSEPTEQNMDTETDDDDEL